MNDIDLDAIRARADAATKGPWFGWHDNDGNGTEVLIAAKQGAGQDALDAGICDVCRVDGSNQDDGQILDWGSGVNLANAEFIAHTREDIPALLVEVVSLRTQLAEREADDMQRSEEGRTDWDYEQKIGRLEAVIERARLHNESAKIPSLTFRRMLSQSPSVALAALQAQAWDEGAKAALRNQHPDIWTPTNNPYTPTEGASQ